MAPPQVSKVPFTDLTRIHAPLKEKILTAISSVIDRSAFVLGSEVETFEREFAGFIGAQHAVGVASGLDALKLALQALGVGPGDEVITAANTFIATAFAISATGATVVLVDVEDDSYNIDPKQVERAITARTKAIIPVHLYGQAATMGPIVDLARARNIPVVEDAAQAHGATYDRKSCGNMGAIGCFSFYPGKNLGAMGEGGAVTTSDENLRAKIRMLRDVGQSRKYVHEVVGHNSRLHTLQAAVLSAKLPGLIAQNDDRRRVAARYGELLGGVEQILLPKIFSDRTPVYHLYVIRILPADSRDKLQKFLATRNIQTLIHYPTPVHLQPCYAALGYSKGRFPVTERLADQILSLPMFPGMTDPEIQAVADGIREFKT